MKNLSLLLTAQVLFIFSFRPAFGSPISPASGEKAAYTYYIFISGVRERTDVLFLEKTVSEKNGVNYFKAERFPVRCFVLKSGHSVTEKEFSAWIGSRFKVMSFGDDEAAKERAYLLFEKSKKSAS